MNKVITLKADDPRNIEYTNLIKSATDEDLVIVARSPENRKDERVKPVAIKNDIYFYLAFDLGNAGTAFLGNWTDEQVGKAKENMFRRARLGDMFSVVFAGGRTLDEWMPDKGEPMNVLTTDAKCFGGGFLLCEDVLKTIWKKLGNYYIVPSSIHEILLIPDSAGLPAEALDGMVKDVNAGGIAVTAHEILSNRSFTVDEWVEGVDDVTDLVQAR